MECPMIVDLFGCSSDSSSFREIPSKRFHSPSPEIRRSSVYGRAMYWRALHTHTHTHELHYRYFGVLALGKTLGDAIIIRHSWAAPSKSSTRQTACEPAPRFRVGRPGSRTSRAEHSAHAFSAVLTHFRRTIPAAYVGRTGVPFFSFLSAFPFGTKLFPFRSGADGG